MRLMRFWKRVPVRLIVLDGSPSPVLEQTLREVGKNFTYIHDQGGLYHRLGLALEILETDYVALAGDDEFYLPAAVGSCLEFLEANPDHISCIGRALGFGCWEGRVFGATQYPKLAGYAVEQESPRDRAVSHLGDYVPSMIYSVVRREAWVDSLRVVTQAEFPFFAAGELQMEILLSAGGKSRVLPHLYWLRSKGETPPIRGSDMSLDEKNRLWDWWETTPSAEKEDFLDRMAEGVERVASEPVEDPRGLVLQACEAYLSAQSAKRKSGGRRAVARKASRLLPPAFHEPLKQWYRHRNGGGTRQRGQQTLTEAARELEAEGVTVAWEELAEVERAVEEFHAVRRQRYGI